MPEHQPDNAAEAIDAYGRPEAVFDPSPGQTTAGVIVGLITAVGGAAFATWADDMSTLNRVGAGVASVGGVALMIYLWRLRRWRLAVCPGGLVQVWGESFQALRWSDMTEMIEARMAGTTGTPVSITAVAVDRQIKVSPVNLQSRKRLFALLVAKAREHGVPTRVEWLKSD